MKTDPRIEPLSVVGELTYTLPALYDGWRVTAIEGGTVTRGGAALAVGDQLAAANVLTFTPVASGGTTTVTVRLDDQEFSGEYSELDGAPAVLTAVTTDATLSGSGTPASPLKVVGGGGGALLLGGGGVAGSRADPGSVTPGVLPAGPHGIELHWEGINLLFGGLRLMGTALGAADVARVEVGFGSDWQVATYAGAALRVDTEVVGGVPQTILRIPEAEQRAAEYGTVHVVLTEGGVSKLGTVPAADMQVDAGCTVRILNWDSGLDTGRGVGLTTLRLGTPAPGVLSPQHMPIVAAPTQPRHMDMARLNEQGGMEIVWPEGGTPYLHVFRPDHFNRQGVSYHLPLTPGLPQ